MQIRIIGTYDECAKITRIIMDTVPKQYIKSISGFYPNKRKCTFSNEGRVYVNFADLPNVAAYALAVVE